MPSRSPRATTIDERLVVELIDSGSREHYADAALYDYEYRRRRADVTFYRELATKRLGGPGRILELGAGSGRVTIPLARDGHDVVAVDQSKAMIARLRSRAENLPGVARSRIKVVEGDLCTFSAPPPKVPLVIAAFNVLEHLYTRGELAACLARVTAHLAPGGAFAFDVQMPDLAWLVRDPDRRWAKTRFTDPSTGRAMFYSTNHDYDPVNQIVTIRLYYDPVDGKGGSRVIKLTQRKYFPAELEALVAAAGFRVVGRFGDFFWAPLDGAAESQVLVVERAETTPKPRRKPTRQR
ncbi:MAG: methyltransferase domain-containing protein [Deltaproteobacteria bacterium]|nr:methyltransferase domain-containing protein [Deltaproteobacteria bacterium]